jgi:hypothetical protein
VCPAFLRRALAAVSILLLVGLLSYVLASIAGTFAERRAAVAE